MKKIIIILVGKYLLYMLGKENEYNNDDIVFYKELKKWVNAKINK